MFKAFFNKMMWDKYNEDNRVKMKDSTLESYEFREMTEHALLMKQKQKKEKNESIVKDIKESFNNIEENNIINAAERGEYTYTVTSYDGVCRDNNIQAAINILNNTKYKNFKWKCKDKDIGFHFNCYVMINWENAGLNNNSL